jgi:hypothetical protein
MVYEFIYAYMGPIRPIGKIIVGKFWRRDPALFAVARDMHVLQLS